MPEIPCLKLMRNELRFPSGPEEGKSVCLLSCSDFTCSSRSESERYSVIAYACDPGPGRKSKRCFGPSFLV